MPSRHLSVALILPWPVVGSCGITLSLPGFSTPEATTPEPWHIVANQFSQPSIIQLKSPHRGKSVVPSVDRRWFPGDGGITLVLFSGTEK
jgi:hypothetical protein